jgi:ATP-dependent helicase/nuclease subunit A
MAVLASAGSGKTTTLVERYLALLLLHPEMGVSQVLAITFTQKAATSMRQRLATRLQEAIAHASPGPQQNRLLALYEDLPSARISTIHAFCAALLRQFPLEAGVDPAFSVLEEVDAAVLRRQAVRHTLEHLADRPNGDPGKEALRRLLGEWERAYVEAVLFSLIQKKRLARTWCRRYARQTPAEIQTSWQEALRQTREPACCALMADAAFLSQLEELARLAPLREGEADSAEKLLAPARPLIRSLGADPSLENALEILPRLAGLLLKEDGSMYSAARLGRKDQWEAQALARFRELLPRLGACLADHSQALSHALKQADARAAEVLVALSLVFLQVEERSARQKGEGALLDFDDLQERALDLLQAHPQVAEHLSRHYRFVMVDEFQDTDPLQWDLLRPLLCAQGRLAADKLFVVGDPKQSIYSFRDADVAVFSQVQRAIDEANREHGRGEVPFLDESGVPLESIPQERLGTLLMAENFRTLPAPIAFVNHLFSRLMQPVEGEPFQVGYDPLKGRRTHDQSSGSVELLLAPVQEGADELDSLQKEAELLARRLRLLLDGADLQVAEEGGLRPPRPSEVAILLRRRRNLGAYEHALRLFGVPFQVVGGLGLYQRQEIYDLANILRLLHNPCDPVALLGALRSPYLGLSDNALYQLTAPHGADLRTCLRDPGRRARLSPGDGRAAQDAVELLSRWEGLRDRVPLVELLHAILEDTGAWGFLSSGERGPQNAANVRKLLDLARAWEGPLSDFVARLDLLTTEEEKEGEAPLEEGGLAVQVLTVHAAKGLEWPIVVVPDLDGPFNLRTGEATLLDREQGIGLMVLDPEREYCRTPSLVRRLITHQYRRRGLAEEKRLFYVACTRARDHLILAGRLRQDHFADHSLEAAPDRLFWLCRGLELKEEDLEGGEKTLVEDGQTFSLRLYTAPEQLSARPWRVPVGEPACRVLWKELGGQEMGQEEGEWPEELKDLKPLEDEQYLPSFSATELALFAQDPEEHYRQYVLGLSPWDLTRPDHPRGRSLLFGELAHAALAAITLFPLQDDQALVQGLLLEAALPEEAVRDSFGRQLLALLGRFRGSAFGARLLAQERRRAEFSFALRLSVGVVNGAIDAVYSEGGLWRLADYKTGSLHTGQKVSEARRHRFQVQLYALCLRELYPGQEQYPATVYFTALDEAHIFYFGTEELDEAKEQLEELVARRVLAGD